MNKDFKLRLSYGTAIGLGLKKARQDTPPTTGYLLWDEGCHGGCSYCSRAHGNNQSLKLSRIPWLEFPLDRVVKQLEALTPLPFKRFCLQTGWNPDAQDRLRLLVALLLEKVRDKSLVSMTLHPAQCDQADEFLGMGLDHIGIGLDAASEATYQTHKKRPWNHDWSSLTNLIGRNPKRIEVHLIYGLGDTEEVFAATVDRLISIEAQVALFAFTPLENGDQPELSAYRRIQAFRYLKMLGRTDIKQCAFKDGRIFSFGIPAKDLQPILSDGEAFRTSGCRDCNRPYYNEKPGGSLFNFPRRLSRQEAQQAIMEMFP